MCGQTGDYAATKSATQHPPACYRWHCAVLLNMQLTATGALPVPATQRCLSSRRACFLLPLQGAAFMGQPLLGRTAYAALHFLELLVGPRCQQLDVENPKVRAHCTRVQIPLVTKPKFCPGPHEAPGELPNLLQQSLLQFELRNGREADCFSCVCACACLQRYNFDQHALLLTMVRLTGQLAQHTAFPQVRLWEPWSQYTELAAGIAEIDNIVCAFGSLHGGVECTAG